MYIPAPEHLQSPRSPAVLPACACTEGGENGRKILSLALPFPSRWHCHSPLCSYVPRSKPPRKFSTPVLHLIRAVICRDRSPLSGGETLADSSASRRGAQSNLPNPRPGKTFAEFDQAPHQAGLRHTNLSLRIPRPNPSRGLRGQDMTLQPRALAVEWWSALSRRPLLIAQSTGCCGRGSRRTKEEGGCF